MFVHWGLYSLIGANEWAMFHDRWTITDYEKLADRFEAPLFDAGAWAATAADAGQKYLTITSRHHDGWSMYDTALSEYKVTRSPFGRDPIAELAEACRKEGVRLGMYVSLLDWHHPAYRAALRERSGLAWTDYLGYLHGQVEELCTQYGDIASFWLDGYWPAEWPISRFPNWFKPAGDFDFPGLYEKIHSLQPDAVVMNNHHLPPLPGEDVQGFEGDVPGENTNAGMNRTAPILDVRETCQTVVTHSYGFNKDDHHYRPADEHLGMLLRAAGSGANFLLNVGPTPEGEIPLPAKSRLAEIGKWLRENGESVYGTRAGHLVVGDNYGTMPLDSATASTSAGNGIHFLHILDGSVPTQFVVDLPDAVHATSVSASLLHDQKAVATEICGDGDTIRLTVPAERRTGSVTTVRLQLNN